MLRYLSRLAQCLDLVVLRASTSSQSAFSRNIRQDFIRKLFLSDNGWPLNLFVEFVVQSDIKFQSRSLGDAFCLFLFDKPSTYIDIGAWEPVLHSESFELENSGWRGVLIEPNPIMANRLREERTSVVLEAAIFSRRASPKSAWLRVDQEASDTARARLVSDLSSIPVSTTSWDEAVGVLSCVPDVVFMDIEGDELQILQDILSLEEKPKVMVIETLTNQNEIASAAVHEGYMEIFPEISGYNTWFVESGMWNEFLKSLPPNQGKLT